MRDARSAGQPERETRIADYARSGLSRDLSDPGAVPGASTLSMETLGGFPYLPTLWLRRAKPAYANAFAQPVSTP